MPAEDAPREARLAGARAAAGGTEGRDMRLRKDGVGIQEGEILLIAGVSEALAHPLRIRLFRHIMKCNAGGTPVCNKDLVAGFDYSQATISQHVKKLVQAGLVQVKRKDSFSLYFVNIGMLKRYVDATQKFDLDR
jgi:ArsR family transcriptional regulator